MLVIRGNAVYTAGMDRNGARTRLARPKRVIGALVVIALSVGLLGACGSSGSDPSPQALAAQDRAVELGNRVALAKADVVAARRRAAFQRRAAAISAALRRASAVPRGLRVLKAFGFTVNDLCAPIGGRGGGRVEREARRARERRRKRVLSYLNVSCGTR